MISFDEILIVSLTTLLMQSVNSREVELGLTSLTTTGSRFWDRNSSIVDPCASAPCLNAGTCIASRYPHSYTCQCVPGYTGATCSKGLDECVGNPCIHGACVDNIGSFRCQCYTGFTGELCDTDINECQNSPCQNGGICNQTLPGLYSCQCPIGYRGFRCETDIDECMALSPCQNGGLCREGPPGNYDCTCLPGFTGKDCEFKVLECSSNPCQNGGRCVEGTGFHTFQCQCLPGFTGRMCQKQQILNGCATNPSLCGENGQCLPPENVDFSGYRCLCRNGMVTNNRSCDENGHRGLTIEPCKSSPCQNGGRCRGGSQGSYRCQCKCGFTGAICQTTLKTFDPNANNPTKECQNGGSCFQRANGQPRCICSSNYTGPNCEVPLDPCTNGSNLCLNNGTCIHNRSGERFYCQCIDGFVGDSCQSRDMNTTIIFNNRGSAFNRSAIDPTLLIVILGVLGTVGILVGTPMLLLYFFRRKRPQDFCFSIPRPRYRRARQDRNTSYSTWIVNSDVISNRKSKSNSVNVTPPLTFYQNPSFLRQF